MRFLAEMQSAFLREDNEIPVLYWSSHPSPRSVNFKKYTFTIFNKTYLNLTF